MRKPKSTFASSGIPLYYQLENVLREKISSGFYSSGEKFPTELQLISEYNISRITVRQALATLAADGLIERKQGKGTFVTDRKSKKRNFNNVVHFTGSLDELIELGIDTPIKILEMNEVKADSHEAEHLQVKIGSPIFRLKRLRLIDEKPYSLILNYLPQNIGLQLSHEELSSGAILEAIETKLGFSLENAVQEIKAELADPYIAKILDIRVGTALLSIERTVFTKEGIPVEYVHTLCRSDLYGYSMKLSRGEKKS
jgi:GntR family transcriptional regulator